jgi:hypothetical protein
MKFLVPLLLVAAARGIAQEDPDAPPGLPRDDPGPARSHSTSQDSLSRYLALIEITRAEAAVSASDFWHRLIPRVQVSASLGAREVLFPDPAGGYLFPRDSYRVTVSIAPAEIFDASRHTLALLHLEEARTRYDLLLGKQSEDRLARVRKRLALTHDLALAQEQMDLARLLLEYYELLFKQGKTEFHILTRARLDAVKSKAGVLELERRVREAGADIP